MSKMRFKDPSLSAKLIQACGVVHNFCLQYNDGLKHLEVADDELEIFEQPNEEPFEQFPLFDSTSFDSEDEVFFWKIKGCHQNDAFGAIFLT